MQGRQEKVRKGGQKVRFAIGDDNLDQMKSSSPSSSSSPRTEPLGDAPTLLERLLVAGSSSNKDKIQHRTGIFSDRRRNFTRRICHSATDVSSLVDDLLLLDDFQPIPFSAPPHLHLIRSVGDYNVVSQLTDNIFIGERIIKSKSKSNLKSSSSPRALSHTTTTATTTSTQKKKRRKENNNNNINKKKENKKVILKFMEKEKIGEKGVRRTRKEYKVMKALDHENIVELYEVYESEFFIVLVMEHAPGGDLFDYLKQSPSDGLPPREAARIFLQLLVAVSYIHENGFFFLPFFFSLSLFFFLSPFFPPFFPFFLRLPFF